MGWLNWLFRAGFSCYARGFYTAAQAAVADSHFRLSPPPVSAWLALQPVNHAADQLPGGHAVDAVDPVRTDDGGGLDFDGDGGDDVAADFADGLRGGGVDLPVFQAA